MASDAQIAANQANSQHSSGPKSEAGKAASCLNNFRWGFCGSFTILESEDEEAYYALLSGLSAEHEPATVTETILVERMAQHHWLTQRAINLQNITMEDQIPMRDKERQFSLFLRYQTTNDRAFYKCLTTLLELRAQKRRAEIGFVSQERKRNEESRKQQEEARRQSVEKRKQDLHRIDVLLAEGKLDNQALINMNLEFANRRQNREEGAQKAA